MPDPEIVNPLPKPIQTAETEIAKVVAFWQDYRLYFVASSATRSNEFAQAR